MIAKTRGIVIKYLKYQDTSIIAHIFTEDYGMMSFLINGIRSPRSKRSIGYFQPFSLLDLVLYLKPNREIQRLSEFKSFSPVHNLQSDIRKGAIVLFLSEVMGKLLVQDHSDSNRALFKFMTSYIMTFDQMEREIENFHLHFLLKALPYLGFGIGDGTEFIHSMEMEMIEDDQKLITFISKILRADLTDPIQGSGELRFKALELILNYYHHHTAPFGEIKSLKVLHQVFN